MNLLYRGCASKENYQIDILEELRAKCLFDFCTIISQTSDEGDKYPKEYYHEILAGHCYSSNYDAINKNIPAVPKEIWKKLLPYKDNALNMTGRVYNMHIMNYEEMNLLYIKNVEFWNWILDFDKIDMAFFTVIPHCLWEYTLYSLCKVKGISTLLIDENWISGMCSVATQIENLGSNTIKCYSKNQLIELDMVELEFYKNKMNSISSISTKEKKTFLKKQNFFVRKCFYGSIGDDIKGLLSGFYRRIILNEKENRNFEYAQKSLEMHVRQRLKRRRLVTKKYFDVHASRNINLEDRYISFFLQYEPESSTLPKADIFCCQLLSIKLLAQVCAKLNIKVYVKEHWAQDVRSKDYYMELLKIPNVYVVNSESDNFTLIDKAIMVASQTGTCIVEAFLRGKPSIMFAYNAISDAPGVHYVTNEEEIISAVKAASVRVEKEEIERYYDAICKTSVRHYLDWPDKWNYTKEECKNDIISLIEGFVLQGMPKDYYFERK